MNNGFAKIIIIAIIGFFILKTCNRNSNRHYSTTAYSSSNTTPSTTSSSWEKSPVDKLISELKNEQNFSIILSDMDSRSGSYYHEYNVLIEKPDTVLTRNTGWEKVSDGFFAANVNNMGMEIVSKKDGKISKKASPAGYNHYVGNPRYGRWTERNGSSFWEFYGKYAFMSSMFNMMTFPARRSYYDDYYRGGYYGSRPYYGPSGRTVYGTKSYTSSAKGKTSTWGSKPSSFKQNVRNQVSRSTSAKSSRSYSSGSSYSKNRSSRTSRSSSRYSSSSSRSRSGGFGK